MKRAIITAFLFFGLTSSEVFAQAPLSVGVVCNPKSQTTNIRSGPTAKGTEIVDKLVNNAAIKILDRVKNPEGTHDWLKVEFKHSQSGTVTTGFIYHEGVSATCLNQQVESTPKNNVTSDLGAINASQDPLVSNPDGCFIYLPASILKRGIYLDRDIIKYRVIKSYKQHSDRACSQLYTLIIAADETDSLCYTEIKITGNVTDKRFYGKVEFSVSQKIKNDYRYCNLNHKDFSGLSFTKKRAGLSEYVYFYGDKIFLDESDYLRATSGGEKYKVVSDISLPNSSDIMKLSRVTFDRATYNLASNNSSNSAEINAVTFLSDGSRALVSVRKKDTSLATIWTKSVEWCEGGFLTERRCYPVDFRLHLQSPFGTYVLSEVDGYRSNENNVVSITRAGSLTLVFIKKSEDKSDKLSMDEAYYGEKGVLKRLGPFHGISLPTSRELTSEAQWLRSNVLSQIPSEQRVAALVHANDIASRHLNVQEAIQSRIYELVRIADTMGSYSWFLSKFPGAKEAHPAMLRLHELAFEAATQINTLEAYNEFIIRFPYAVQVKIANERALGFEREKYTTFKNDDERRRFSNALLIRAKRIDREGSNQSDEAAKMGYTIIFARMTSLLEKTFDTDDATVRYLESEELKRHFKQLSGVMRRIETAVEEIRNTSADIKNLVEEQTVLIDKRFSEASEERAINEKYAQQHRDWHQSVESNRN